MIDLYDIVKIKELDEDEIKVKSISLDIFLDEDNIVYKVVKIFKNKFYIKKGVEIFIEKNIFVVVGMVGGSFNVVVVLVGLNYLWEFRLFEDELKEIGFNLGVDVFFCILGRFVLV